MSKRYIINGQDLAGLAGYNIRVGANEQKLALDEHIYISGDANTDNSVRIIVSESTKIARMEKRIRGAWQPTELTLGAGTLFLGENMGISVAGHQLMTEHINSDDKHVFAYTDLNNQGTGSLKVMHFDTKLVRYVSQSDDSSEFVGKVYGHATTTTANSMMSKVYVKIGSVAATAPVLVQIFEGTDATGEIIWQFNYPASDYGPINTEVAHEMPGLLELVVGEDIYTKFTSDENFSMKTNAAGTAPWTAVDMFLTHHNEVLITREWTSGSTHAIGEWFVDHDTRKIYVCDSTGVQTGTFADNSDKWDLLGDLYIDSLLTPGSVAFGGSDGKIIGGNELFWDETNNRFGVVGDIISKGTDWTSRISATDNIWRSVTYGNGLFVAVAASGSGDRVMTSPDGINWTLRTTPNDNNWVSVTYGHGLFVAVSNSGSSNRIMTSPDGITWTPRTTPNDISWRSIAYGNGMFVAVAITGLNNRVMTSPDGINWTTRTNPVNNAWYGITYGNGLFVAVSANGTNDRVMTSPDGITWTSRTSAADNNWGSVTYGNGLFVAVSYSGSGNRVMTSPDGINWTIRTSAVNSNWYGVTYGNGLFVAVALTGGSGKVMTSPDGINWTVRPSATNNWYSVIYGNGMFVAVAITGTDDRVMTSGKTELNIVPTNKLYPGTPSTASSPGNAGDIAWDSDYIYVCVDTNTWKRSAIATW